MKIKTRRRKAPVTSSSRNDVRSTSSAGVDSANPRTSARLIRRFHVLLRREAQLEKKLTMLNSTTATHTTTTTTTRAEAEEGVQRELEEVREEIGRLGGLEVYQRMSRIGQGKDRGGGSERVFVEWLRELGAHVGRRREEEGKGKGKMRLLEVGALKPDNYASCSGWLDVRPIDLRATHLGIVEQDFLQMDPVAEEEAWDAISLSLVLNFVPEPRDRCRMLCLAHKLLRDDGLLFLVLPLPCVSNSRYLTFEHLTQLMAHIGFTTVRERWKDGGKMAYWLFRKCTTKDSTIGQEVHFDKKVVLREGKRNNFCILL